jgi:hypothetical protein
MRWNPRLWLSGLRLHVRIWLIVGSLNLITLVLTIWLLTWMTRRFVEDAIGDQMVVQARHHHARPSDRPRPGPAR